MIPSLRPAAAATVPLLLAALLLPGPRAILHAADDDAAPRRASAAELLDSMHVDQTVANAGKRMLTGLDGVADRMGKQPNLTPEQTKDIEKFRGEVHALVDQQLGWDAIKPDLAQAYADEFTESELKELNAFYHTPTGQKLVQKQPELYAKMSQVMQKKSATLAPSLQQKMQALRAEVHPTPLATPAVPVKIPAVGPTASPTTVVIPAASPAATTAVTAPVALPTAAAPAGAAPSVTPKPAPATTPAS